MRQEVEQQIQQLQMLIQDEENKLAKYKKENQARRHNFVPMILELLQCLAEMDRLPK